MSTSELIEHASKIVGSMDRLGELCGCSQHKIWKAKKTGKVDAELARNIHWATNGEVPASKLRPDLWILPEHVPPLAPETVSREGETVS